MRRRVRVGRDRGPRVGDGPVARRADEECCFKKESAFGPHSGGEKRRSTERRERILSAGWCAADVATRALSLVSTSGEGDVGEFGRDVGGEVGVGGLDVDLELGVAQLDEQRDVRPVAVLRVPTRARDAGPLQVGWFFETGGDFAEEAHQWVCCTRAVRAISPHPPPFRIGARVGSSRVAGRGERLEVCVSPEIRKIVLLVPREREGG